MSVIEAIVLGAVQGITEFLPISSSGHLAIADHLFGAFFSQERVPLAFDVLLHFASVLAILLVLRHDVWLLLTSRRRLLPLLVIGTIPAAVAGLLLEDYFDAAKQCMPAVGGALMFTGLVLALSERIGRRTRRLEATRARDAAAVGLAQVLALMPGVSRSGMTIGGGLLCGMTRDACVRFSFLLAIPVILGASALKLPEMFELGDEGEAAAMIAGAAASLAASIAAIQVLLALVRRASLAVFSYYCVPVGMIVVIASAPHPLAGWLSSAIGMGDTAAVIVSYAVVIAAAACIAAIVFVGILRRKPAAAAQQ